MSIKRNIVDKLYSIPLSFFFIIITNISFAHELLNISQALSMGIDASRIKMAIKRRLETAGTGFETAQQLINAAFSVQVGIRMGYSCFSKYRLFEKYSSVFRESRRTGLGLKIVRTTLHFSELQKSREPIK